MEPNDESSVDKDYLLKQLNLLHKAHHNENSLTPAPIPLLVEACCSLWDVTVNESLCRFLFEHDMIQLVVSTCKEKEDARLKEVCFGILGNLAAVPEMCEHLCGKELKSLVINNLQSTQPALLNELFRFLQGVLFNGSSQAAWIEILDEAVLSQILLIFASTLDEGLCEKAALLIHQLCGHEQIFRSLVEKLDLMDVLGDLLQYKLSTSYKNKKINECPEMSAIMAMLEDLSTNALVFPKIFGNQNSISKSLMKIILKSEEEIFISACLSLVNIEMENPKSVLCGDIEFLKGLVSHIDFCLKEEIVVIFTILNEVSEQLLKNTTKHTKIITYLTPQIETLLESLRDLEIESYVIQFFQNYNDLLMKLNPDTPDTKLITIRNSIQNFLSQHQTK